MYRRNRRAGAEGSRRTGRRDINRPGHALQSATRAENDGADIDRVVAALLHDIGDGLAPADHDKFAAEIIRPHAREECAWVVENHGAFQKVYYMHHYGGDPNERDNFRDHPCFQACVNFCERRDRSSFDPYYPTRPLEYFAPMAHGVFPRRCGKVWRPACRLFEPVRVTADHPGGVSVPPLSGICMITVSSQRPCLKPEPPIVPEWVNPAAS